MGAAVADNDRVTTNAVATRTRTVARDKVRDLEDIAAPRMTVRRRGGGAVTVIVTWERSHSNWWTGRTGMAGDHRWSSDVPVRSRELLVDG
ncbi:hypothetical protein GCM10009557_56760 [Virgisporangium ochraceum]|uniref:Uncharacterized protein n=1 Tax=Virgisporangium ochraceum TaxID=65505 RepID=A0A8J3ZU36_9ACTN|nr:hypothetical protein Voc01_045780 [Virgisporangium ochraceum]